MILYDFQCKCGSKFEALVSMSDTTYKCKRCGELANRLISTPRIKLEGWSGHFPTAKQKFIKMHEKESRKTTEQQPSFINTITHQGGNMSRDLEDRAIPKLVNSPPKTTTNTKTIINLMI